MGSLRKLIASVSVFALIFTITGITTIASAFVDVPDGVWYEEPLNWAVAEGVVDDADYFRPGDNMNRAEMAKMVVEGLGVATDTSAGPSFVDVAEGAWYYGVVETGVANGLFSGYTDADGLPTGYYGPGDYTTRAAVAKVLVLAYGFEMAECDTTFSDVDYSAWYGPYMDTACHYGLVDQGRPADLVSRAEFVTMLSRAANYEPGAVVEEDDDEDEEEEVVVTPPSDGSLMVSVAPSTPMGSTIPSDAAAIGYTQFAFTASGDDVTLNGLTVWRNGLGSSENFSEVWVSVDNFKAGAERSINTDDMANLTLSSDYIVIPEGETVLVDIKASMASSVGANVQNRLGLKTAADVDTNAAAVLGSFPMYGNYMTTSSYSQGSARFSSDGSATTIDVGEVQTIIGEFEVENQSTNNEDFIMATMDLEINGSGNFDNIANAGVYYLGERISDVITPSDDHLRFTFLDGGFVVEDGETRNFDVKADVVKGDDGDTLFLQLDDDNDFTVLNAENEGAAYAVDISRTSPTTGVLPTYTLNAGTITFARDASSASATEITDDIDGVTFLVANVTIGEDVKIEESRVYLDASIDTLSNGTTAATTCSGSGTTATITDGSTTETLHSTTIKDKIDDIKIWDGGRLAAGGENTLADVGTVAFASGACSVTNAYYTFTDNYDLSAGTHLLSITADISNNASSNETFALSFDNTPSSWLSAEYTLSNDTVATADINGSASGAVFTIEAATLTLSRQDGFPDNEDMVVGFDDQVILTFKVENSDAGDVTITDFDLQDATVDADGSLVTGIGVYEAGTDNLIVTALQDLGSDDTVQFDGISYVVPSGGFALFDVRASLSTSWAVTDDLDLFLTGMEADDVNNNAATISYPNCLSGCTTNNALAFASFDLNAGAQVTIAFDARNDSDYDDIQVPTGNCSDGSCAVRVAQLEFHPVFDDVILKKLVLDNNDGTDDFSQRFGTFFLVDEATGEVMDTGTLSDGGTDDGSVTFDGFSYLLPKDEYYNLNVLAEINSITRASQTGKYVELFLDTPTTDTLQITSDATGSDIDVTDTAIVINNADESDDYLQTHIARRSVPYITYNNDEISTAITGTVTNKEVYKFTVSADDAGDVEWERLTFDVSETSGLTSGTYLLYVEGESSAINSSASVSSGEVVIDPTSIQSIPAGLSTTYVLKANVTISSPSASQTLSVELTAEDDTALITDSVADLVTASSDFIWSDRAAQSHTTTTDDWSDGYEIDSFDVSTVNVGYQGTG